MQNFLGLGAVATGIGLVLTVWAWKLNPSGANWMLVLAWALFVMSTYSAVPLVSNLPLIPRVLSTMTTSGLIGLALYFFLWTPSHELVSSPGKTVALSGAALNDEIDELSDLMRNCHEALTVMVHHPTQETLADLLEKQNRIREWLRQHRGVTEAELFWLAPLDKTLPSGVKLEDEFVDAFQLVNSRLNYLASFIRRSRG